MGKVDLRFEIKAMGKTFIVPIIIIIGTIIHNMYLVKVFQMDYISGIIGKLEFLIVPSIIIWIVCIFYEYYDNNSLELLLSYPLKGREHVLWKVLSFIIIYSVMLTPIFISILNENREAVMPIILQIIPQIIFISGLTVIIIVIFRSVGIALALVVGYVSIEFLTKGGLMPWYHLFYFNFEVLPFNILFIRGIINISIGIIFLILSSIIIKECK